MAFVSQVDQVKRCRTGRRDRSVIIPPYSSEYTSPLYHPHPPGHHWEPHSNNSFNNQDFLKTSPDKRGQHPYLAEKIPVKISSDWCDFWTLLDISPKVSLELGEVVPIDLEDFTHKEHAIAFSWQPSTRGNLRLKFLTNILYYPTKSK